MLEKPIYVLGTGLSHNGSAVLLKDGKVCVGIEKERITKIKHDGGNDSVAIQYCLDAEGITMNEISLVVQSANFEVPDRKKYGGKRLFADFPELPLVTISHHLAHAYSAAGTCDFDECAIMIIDGCGSPSDQCMDISGTTVVHGLNDNQMVCEKDSFYYFDGRKVTALYKDFSEMSDDHTEAAGMQTTKHSIGGFYAAVSHYVFGNLDDVGKLMGLAPYGKPGWESPDAFRIVNGRLFVEDAWKKLLTKPAESAFSFREDFQYYADIAFWAQQQVEQAVQQVFRNRMETFPSENVAYSGGVALNAVANARLLNEGTVGKLYIEPAAGDNGLALGCSYYGWLETLGKPRVPHDGNTCFGRSYSNAEMEAALRTSGGLSFEQLPFGELCERTAKALADGKIAGWSRHGSEFGPRALGHRSILAHPGIAGLGDRINAEVKFREDFRPFAPAVLPGFASQYFESGRKSPYMILVDRTKESHIPLLQNVTHVNHTARVQTVDESWNADFARLLQAFHEISGIPVLLNTSLNKKGMPMAESPADAIVLFLEGALDLLVLGDFLVWKH